MLPRNNVYCEKTFSNKTDIKIDLIPETVLDENEEEEQCNALETKEGKYKLRMSFSLHNSHHLLVWIQKSLKTLNHFMCLEY